METTIVFWGYIGIMGKKKETIIVYLGLNTCQYFLGFWHDYGVPRRDLNVGNYSGPTIPITPNKADFLRHVHVFSI